jgi:hypothetical protein
METLSPTFSRDTFPEGLYCCPFPNRCKDEPNKTERVIGCYAVPWKSLGHFSKPTTSRE